MSPIRGLLLQTECGVRRYLSRCKCVVTVLGASSRHRVCCCALRWWRRRRRSGGRRRRVRPRAFLQWQLCCGSPPLRPALSQSQSGSPPPCWLAWGRGRSGSDSKPTRSRPTRRNTNRIKTSCRAAAAAPVYRSMAIAVLTFHHESFFYARWCSDESAFD